MSTYQRKWLNIQLLKINPNPCLYITNPGRSMEFHISRSARLKYKFDNTLFGLSGNVILADFRSARNLAKKINDKRDVVNFPEKAIRAGQINAMGLIDEILHYVVQLYRETQVKEITSELVQFLEQEIGKKNFAKILESFTILFPPLKVHLNQMSVEQYLNSKTAGINNNEIAVEELLLLWLSNLNPAFSPFKELFDDSELKMHPLYLKITELFYKFFDNKPTFGPENQNLVGMLRSPAIAVPHSLTGQLEYIREKWGLLLGKYFYRLLRSLDFLKEEDKMGWFGPGPTSAYEFDKYRIEFEAERFSPDKHWMPRIVLIAKSVYVWLDQLSKKYQRHISRLDQIPEQEIDTLARWGFTGLWLIGLWERSQSSRNIKRMCGNPEAVASAYSLFDYQISQDLGGEEAFQNLRSRCWEKGIRMCGDMVPNHMGIDSKWVIEHPDWFVSLDYSPYPAYSFNGANHSWDNRVGIYIEDHYYSRTDAAVVFKRVDFFNGNTKYIYHGNDGTSMPWNDTAQLNYLKPEVREAVIQTILNVARKFSVIRFDAAMTLTKRHYQRLWFPEPGSGGDIPSRAEHGISKDVFDSAMPEEFWREVVDRIALEVPDTLLLAEAFWLMEGYFVRTLGMHRVYNSAFMNMLKNEENIKYRTSIKNVLEFNPEILKRFVNFMNNPDEETAVEQFGKDDKYFGVCVMMVTMPGLPMFGHGQVEGLKEKYGMEYKKAYWDETPDHYFIQRHEREIFPLIRKRYLFAEVENFLLYDFFTPEGYVNENVFAYSNRFDGERGLVVYNNKFEEAKGWIKTSTAYSVKSAGNDNRIMIQKNLGEGLGLSYEGNRFLIFRDQITGLEFIRKSQELYDQGLYVELGAFKYHVFLDLREISDNQWHHYAHLTTYLEGRGVPNIEQALKETFLKPVHQPFSELINATQYKELFVARRVTPQKTLGQDVLDALQHKYFVLLYEIKHYTEGKGDVEALKEVFGKELRTLLTLPVLEKEWSSKKFPLTKQTLKWFNKHLQSNKMLWFSLFGWQVIHRLGAVVTKEYFEEISYSGMDEWLLVKILEDSFYEAGFNGDEVYRLVSWIKILTLHQGWWKVGKDKHHITYKLMQNLLKDFLVQSWLKINRYRDILWYNQEAFENLLVSLLSIAVIQIVALTPSSQEVDDTLRSINSIVKKMLDADKISQYQVSKLLDNLKK